jgi:hypothetical protein
MYTLHGSDVAQARGAHKGRSLMIHQTAKLIVRASAARSLVVMLLVSVGLGGCVLDVAEDADRVGVGVVAAPLLQEVFFDDFSAGLASFTETGEGDWNTEALISAAGYPASGSGAPAAHSDNCDTTCTITTAIPIDLSEATSARVELLRFVSSLLDAGELLEVQVWNGSSFVRERYWTDGSGDDSRWHAEVIDLAPYLGVSDFRIRFITRQDSSLEHVHIDDLRVLVESDSSGPSCGDEACSAGETCSSCPADCGACPGVDLFVDSFASLANWTESGEGDWNVESLHSTSGYPAGASGSPAAHSDNCGTSCTLTLTRSIDLTSVQSATLSFLRFVDVQLDAGEYLRIELFDGTSWNTAFFLTDGVGDSDRWQLETVNLTGYVGRPSFRIRLSTSSNSILEHVHIDDLRVTTGGQPLGSFVVSRANIEDHIEFLAQAPRAPGTPHLVAAREYCEDRLVGLGYSVEVMPFNMSGLSGVNVIGTRLGTARPNERVIVSAHVDSVPNCLGADDNASGVAGMLEIARLLAQQPHARTTVAACWDLEEIDLLGARAYAQRANARGETIHASLVLDMIGYRSHAPNSQQLPGGSDFGLAFPAMYGELQANQFRGDFISVVADGPGVFSPAGSMPVLAYLEQAAAETGVSAIGIAIDEASLEQFQDLLRSDHAAFWQEGYSALVLTDSGEFRNPYYHCPSGSSDAPATLDYELARRVSQATAQAARRALND